MTKLRIDSRDKDYYQKYGQTIPSNLPTETNFGDILISEAEAINGEDCTALSTCKVFTSKTKKLYDVNALWDKVSPNNQPVDPRQTLNVAVKGLTCTDGTVDNTLQSYYRADTGDYDSATNIRSAMNREQCSVMANTEWFDIWCALVALEVMPEGAGEYSSHSWVLVDVKLVNGVSMFLIDWHGGRFEYMTFDELNELMTVTGTSSFVPVESPLDIPPSKTFWQSALDIITNAWIEITSIRKEINQLPMQPTASTQPTKIQQWANAIAHWEGANPLSNNPGNMKYTTLTASWGALKGKQASDGGYLCQFPTYAQGFTALCNFLTLGCEDELLAFHQARTLQNFTQIYAGNPPQTYIQGIAQLLGVSLDVQISTFL